MDEEFDGYVAVDIETTGLDPDYDDILEVGIVIVTKEFHYVGERNWVLHVPYAYDKADDYVKEMHSRNGLFDECAVADSALNLSKNIVYWIDNLVGKNISFPMTGSTINFDRSFLAKQMPVLESRFHYRNIDVSTINRWIRRFGWVPPEGDELHRAVPDCWDTLRTLRSAERFIEQKIED